MKKMLKEDKKNKDLCKRCSKCCRYIATEIDRPTSEEDFENIIWFLYHKNVGVYLGHDNKWYLEFVTPCKELNFRGFCKVYDKRPQICRDYNQNECPQYNDGPTEKQYFHSVEEFKKYLEDKKSKKEKKKK